MDSAERWITFCKSLDKADEIHESGSKSDALVKPDNDFDSLQQSM